MPKPVTWTEEKIFDSIKKRFLEKKSFGSTEVFNTEPAFWQVCRRKYGSWKEAVDAFLEENSEFRSPEINLILRKNSKRKLNQKSKTILKKKKKRNLQQLKLKF